MSECLDAGFRVAQEIGLNKGTSRLILSPFAPFRTYDHSVFPEPQIRFTCLPNPWHHSIFKTAIH